MTDEEYENEMNMVKYFWEEKRDATRYTGWGKVKSEIERREPHILQAIENYENAERTVSALLEKW